MSRVKISLFVSLAAVVLVAAVAPMIAEPVSLKSGVEVGGNLAAYNPTHLTGPDKNTSTCPVCKYPRNPAVQAWINTDDDKNVAALVGALERISRANSEAKFKAFVVYLNPQSKPAAAVAEKLNRIGTAQKVEHVALTYVAGPSDAAVKTYGINTDARVRNTIFVYKNRTVASKFVNFTADDKGIAALTEAVAKVVQ